MWCDDKGAYQLPTAEDKETMHHIPSRWTAVANTTNKARRKAIGNAWHVGVASLLLAMILWRYHTLQQQRRYDNSPTQWGTPPSNRWRTYGAQPHFYVDQHKQPPTTTSSSQPLTCGSTGNTLTNNSAQIITGHNWNPGYIKSFVSGITGDHACRTSGVRWWTK